MNLQNDLKKFLGLDEIPQLKKWDAVDNGEGEKYWQLEVAFDEVYSYGNIQDRDADYNAMVEWIKENYEADCPYCEVGNCLIDEFTMCDGASGDIDGLIAEKITYKVYGYKTQNDFENRNFKIVEEGLNKKDAMQLAKDALKEYAVVKVQSYDREFIEILGDNRDVLVWHTQENN